MEIKEKKYYCPKCFKQVNKQPGFDPLLSAWTCVNCGYEFKINNVENYQAPNIEPAKEAPVVDTDVIEYDENVQEIEPVDEAPVAEEAVEEPANNDESGPAETEPEIINQETVSEPVEQAASNEPEIVEEIPSAQSNEEPEIIDVEPVETEAVEQTHVEEVKPETTVEQEEEAASDEVEETKPEPSDEAKPESSDDHGIDFSSTAENEEVQEKKVGFFGKLFGDEKPREKSKNVLDFLRDEDQEEVEEIQEETPVRQDTSFEENQNYTPDVSGESSDSEPSNVSYESQEPFVSKPSYENPDPFNMESEQAQLESEIQQEPKKPGFMESFFEKQEQKQSEKDVERMQKDRERMEQAIDRRDYRRKKRRQWAMTHWTWIACGILILILACFGGYKFYQWRKLTVVGINSQECVDKNYVDVVDEFADHGFTNVKAVPVEDLNLADLDKEGQIISVSIDENLTFNTESKFAYDAPVIIQYHAASKVVVPMSSSDARRLSYTEVVAKFKEAGFENIDINKQEDLIVGWLRSDGQVAHITIGGSENFRQGDAFRVDSKVIVTYHTFKQDESQKEEDKKEDKKEESKKEESKKEESKEDSKKEESSTSESKKEESTTSDSKKEDTSETQTGKE